MVKLVGDEEDNQREDVFVAGHACHCVASHKFAESFILANRLHLHPRMHARQTRALLHMTLGPWASVATLHPTAAIQLAASTGCVVSNWTTLLLALAGLISDTTD